ncbi:DUF6765 family protein [Vibrio parahaemolyticus]|uniref:DUF6765 family protein n=1 Tax=Vibrio parahaemolyticus TaxID=670 RepID=UPI0034A0C055
MQIDGHHTLTYVIARYAGGGGGINAAKKKAYSAQKGDDATKQLSPPRTHQRAT